ncbi:MULTISPECIES: SixA phosphatase family protein [Allobranchiibius]|uniref:Phosphohistidine phosphatase n=1 Tax=Allobranchiibius huperziae TaxID=1874116 RepID=A0A853DES5_9MICO|nr:MULTISPECIES: histidine phosphatase family protein [Allobranchiibius]NYJ75328.1 phosphohistidine phosphatase [Allobranchiibius huperziae]UIJ33335.1 histidine phosphatase family protein [Allobranchiibius sp. GilTou73]
MTTDRHRLVLIRHAQAASGDADTPDHDRPLTDRGHQDAAALGRWLKDADIRPQETRCSTATRTRETWAAVVEAAAIGAIVEHDQRIYNADPSALLEVLHEADPKAETVVMVGHAPGIPHFAASLADGQGDAEALEELERGYPTCTVAVLDIDGEWDQLASGGAQLRAVHTARAD